MLYFPWGYVGLLGVFVEIQVEKAQALESGEPTMYQTHSVTGRVYNRG